MFIWPFLIKRRLSDQRGFSLIEMIMVLVLMGLTGVIASFGIMRLMEGFVFTRDASSVAGRGQLAMLRLSDEFRKIKSVSSGTATAITFTAVHDDDGDGVTNPFTATVSLDGSSNLMMNSGSNDILVDGVQNLNLQYYDPSDLNNPASTWSNSHWIIGINLTLKGPEGSNPILKTRIAPRNI